MRSIDGGVEVEADMSRHYKECPKMSILCHFLSFQNAFRIGHIMVDKFKAALAKELGQSPRQVADAVLAQCAGLTDICSSVEVAGPGFLNLVFNI